MMAIASCSQADDARERNDPKGPLIVFNAGSLARPLRIAADTFAAREGVPIEQENAGSLETARKLTELGKTPDVIALADHELFPQVLMPGHVTWYVQFARNRMVLAFTDRSLHADEISTANWQDVLQRTGVEVGRADPYLDPNGYRTLLTLQLAERHYGRPGLADALLAKSPQRNVRSKEADLIALLQTGEFDYVWSYESIAQGIGLRYVTLPSEIDLGSPSHAALYATAVVKVAGRVPTDTITFRGAPIVYGLSIPTNAPHRALAEKFVGWLLSDEGRRVLRSARLDALEMPVLVGTGAPGSILTFARTTPSR